LKNIHELKMESLDDNIEVTSEVEWLYYGSLVHAFIKIFGIYLDLKINPVHSIV
jgi:hypothetical protein